MFNRTGGPEVLEIIDVPVQEPLANEVQFRVRAIGINRAEAMSRAGMFGPPPKFPAGLGLEASGVVESVGPGVTEFSPGDKVSVVDPLSPADYPMYGEVAKAPVSALVRNADGQSFEEAAATWVMFLTAYGIIESGIIKSGDYILIGAASSSVGIAAIQIANVVGAKPIALTRTSKKRDSLLKAGAAEVIAIQEQDIPSEVARITAGKGAKVAFDPVAGPGTSKLTSSLSHGGKLIVYGALDPRNLSLPVMDIIVKHVTVSGFQTSQVTSSNEVLSRAVKFVKDGLSAGKLKPVIDKVFPFNEIAEAHRYLEANGQVGKIVVSV